RSPVPCRPHARRARGVGTYVEADPDTGVAPRAVVARRDRRAVGTYPREVRRVGWRDLEQGVHAALTGGRRPKPAKLLDTRQQAAIVGWSVVRLRPAMPGGPCG